MTMDAASKLDIIRRIAIRLREEDEPGRSTVEAEFELEGERSEGRTPATPEDTASVASYSNLRFGHKKSEPSASARDEHGFTLPEMLITMVLVLGASALIATAIYQIFIVAQDGNARLSVLGDVQNAALWIGRDATESASWSAGAGTVYGTLTTGDPLVQYRYSYDMPSTSLVREHLVSGSPVSTMNIARRIANQGDVSFSVSGTLLSVSITGTSGTVSESATLKLGMRVK